MSDYQVIVISLLTAIIALLVLICMGVGGLLNDIIDLLQVQAVAP